MSYEPFTAPDDREKVLSKLGGKSKKEYSLKKKNNDTSREMIEQMLAEGASATGIASPEQQLQAGPNIKSFKSQMSGGLEPLSPLGKLGGGVTLPGGSAKAPQSASGGPQAGEFTSNVERLIADAPGKVSISSGTRSNTRQKQLWTQALEKYGSESAARKWVAPPAGTKMSDGSIAQGSRHESGLANDLSFQDDATRKWVHENARKYGLHFPLSNENWHIEAIGTRS